MLFRSACAQTPSANEESRARLARAEAMFAERCKKAGEFIHRTADNVEGIFLFKVRPRGINYGDQYRMDDPYGRGVGGDGYIADFLYGRDEKDSLVERDAKTRGYGYVEAIDEQDGKRYRYTGGMKAVGRMDVTAIDRKSTRLNSSHT